MKSTMEPAIARTFQALFALEDLRQIWRDTAPLHNLSEKQTLEAQALLRDVKSYADEILGSLEK